MQGAEVAKEHAQIDMADGKPKHYPRNGQFRRKLDADLQLSIQRHWQFIFLITAAFDRPRDYIRRNRLAPSNIEGPLLREFHVFAAIDAACEARVCTVRYKVEDDPPHHGSRRPTNCISL
jgi:hypothetical protein